MFCIRDANLHTNYVRTPLFTLPHIRTHKHEPIGRLGLLRCGVLSALVCEAELCEIIREICLERDRFVVVVVWCDMLLCFELCEKRENGKCVRSSSSALCERMCESGFWLRRWHQSGLKWLKVICTYYTHWRKKFRYLGGFFDEEKFQFIIYLFNISIPHLYMLYIYHWFKLNFTYHKDSI